MALWLRQSTSVDVALGPFVDDADGKTAETTLTLTQPDIRLKKNGGAWAQKAAAQTLAHEENGWYEVTLDATDTNTLGHLRVAVHEAGALPVWQDFMVVPANVYDSLVAGSDVLDVSLIQWLGAAPNALVSGRPDASVGAYASGQAPLQPTTAGRTLDVTATGAAGVDWGNVENQGTEVELFTTTISKVSDVMNDVQGSVNGDVVGGVLGSVGSVAADGITALSIAADAGAELADALLDKANGVESGVTLRQALRGIIAVLLGKASGMAGTTATFRDTNDTKDRVVATVDASGNRTAVTRDLS